MRFIVTLCCEGSDCKTDPSKYPTGTFSDFRIGRAVLEKDAKAKGWKRVPPKMVRLDGDLYMQQMAWFCSRCQR